MQFNTDSELLDGCLRRDSKAQAALYHKYKGRFFGICRRYTQSKEEAEDIFQDAFVKVFSNLKELRSADQLSAWIRRVVVNVCIDYYHKRITFVDIAEVPEMAPADWQSDSVIARMNNQELLSLVNELPDGARMVFNLFVIDGYGHQEIARMLGISEGTSKSQLFFAKKLLKKKLQTIGVTID